MHWTDRSNDNIATLERDEDAVSTANLLDSLRQIKDEAQNVTGSVSAFLTHTAERDA